MIKEAWKPIKNYEGWYSISNYGRVRRDMQCSGTQAGRIRKEHLDSDGYSDVLLHRNSKGRHFKVHQLVASHFIGECPVGMEVNHKDNVRNNNLYTNLEYKTHQANVLHSYKMGRSRLTGGRKINEQIILSIKREYATGNYSNKSLGKVFSVDASTISRVINGRTWKHLYDIDNQQPQIQTP